MPKADRGRRDYRPELPGRQMYGEEIQECVICITESSI